MRIIQVLDSKRRPGVEIRAVLGVSEFQHLRGALDNLCVFATQTITEPATCVRTGARHSHAKYFLLPVKLRRQLPARDIDFSTLACGAIEYKDKVYVVYEVSRNIPKKGTDEKDD